MSENSPWVDRDVDANVSRRGIIALIGGGATVGLGGVYGFRRMTGTVRASSHIEFDDGTITLEEDEDIDTVTIEGTASAEYDISGADDEAATAGMSVHISSESDDIESFREHFPYEEVDPERDSFSEDISLSRTLPDDIADPDPGEETSTEFYATVRMGVDNEDDQEIIEAPPESDTAVLTVSRLEADDNGEDDDDNDDGDDDDDDDTFEASISGSFHFVEADDD